MSANVLFMQASMNGVSSTRAASVTRAASLCEAVKLARSGARCVVVGGVFARARIHLPTGFDERDMLIDADGCGAHTIRNGALRSALTALARAHCDATGASTARARVARVCGTPCPRAHVDS
eukprot:IDg19116t1